MNNLKGFLLLVSLFAVVSVCGYRGESLGSLLSSLSTPLSGNSSDTAGDVTASAAKEEIPKKKPLAPPATAAKPLQPDPSKQAAPFYQMLQKQRQNPSRGDTPPPPAGPPTIAKSQNWQGSMKDTLNSINRESIDDGQRLRRNDYFNKLSKQMEQMRGKKPGEAADDTAEAEAAPDPEVDPAEDLEENLEAEVAGDAPGAGQVEDAQEIDELDEAIEDLIGESEELLQ